MKSKHHLYLKKRIILCASFVDCFIYVQKKEESESSLNLLTRMTNECEILTIDLNKWYRSHESHTTTIDLLDYIRSTACGVYSIFIRELSFGTWQLHRHNNDK